MKDRAALNVRAVRMRILAWYRKHKRELPWRGTPEPYKIWISEIMLQQTRVAAVIPYYERFLEQFPDVAALASAPETELLQAWAGLGYYSRVRNLQKAAKKILELGVFPGDHSTIRGLPGVGDYTAAAIASIAFGLPHAVVDGNVRRVLSRLTGERGSIDSAAVRRRLVRIADKLLDPRQPGEFNQGLMELGATVCLPRWPMCPRCPLVRQCEARRAGVENQLPLKSGRDAPAGVEKQVLVIEKAGKILAWKRPADSRRLAGFWELPELDQVRGATVEGKVGQFRHTIVNTAYRVHVFRGSLVTIPKGFRWLGRKNLDKTPLSTTARKALACLTQQEK